MTKKRFYDEHGNKIRSRPPKPFYKKWILWVFVLGVSLGIIIMYVLGGENEPIKQGVDEEVKKVEEAVIKDPELVKPEHEIIEDQTYTYEDFQGTYVTFQGEPYNSPLKSMGSNIIVLGEDFYQSFNRWDFDMTSTILNQTIEGNVLTLDLDSDESEMWGLHSESGTEQFELRHDGDKKVLYSTTKDEPLYSMSNQDLQAHYSQLEIDYARIIMTINCVPSLDQWAVWNDESGVPVVNVRYTSAGDHTEVSYPEDVTHLDLTRQGMANGIITYSPHGDGHITRYPMPLHDHQTEQSEEKLQQLAQESLDDAYTIYIEPLDPYTVADFIGHVEFVYE